LPNAGRRPSYQTNRWRRGPQRDRVYRRDGYKCRECGRAGKQIGGTRTLSLQHVVPERIITQIRLEHIPDHWLLTLCLQCHGRADGGRRYDNNGRVIR
jgi:5-methylcytosine-specific restriction endonuclease McrA